MRRHIAPAGASLDVFQKKFPQRTRYRGSAGTCGIARKQKKQRRTRFNFPIPELLP
jgi:hypothetical protein